MAEVSTRPTSPNTILLRGHLGQRPMEGRVATAKTLTPGYLIERTTAGDEPYGSWQPHSTAAGQAEKVVCLEMGMIADVPGETFNGGTIDDTIAATKLFFGHLCMPGDELYMWVPASASAIVLTDFLTSNGDGTLKKGATTDVRLFKPLEAVNNSAGSSKARIRVRAL